jgi:hypothetical protein
MLERKLNSGLFCWRSLALTLILSPKQREQQSMSLDFSIAFLTGSVFAKAEKAGKETTIRNHRKTASVFSSPWGEVGVRESVHPK